MLRVEAAGRSPRFDSLRSLNEQVVLLWSSAAAGRPPRFDALRSLNEQVGLLVE